MWELVKEAELVVMEDEHQALFEGPWPEEVVDLPDFPEVEDDEGGETLS